MKNYSNFINNIKIFLTVIYKVLLEFKIVFLKKRTLLLVMMLMFTLGAFPMLAFDAKEVKFKVDGKEYVKETNKAFSQTLVDDFMERQNLDNYIVDNINSKFVKDDETYTFHSEKNVVVNIEGQEKEYKTYADTVEEFLKEQDINLEENNETLSGASEDTLLIDDNEFSIDKMTSKTSEKIVEKNLPIKYVEDSSIYKGDEKVETEGSPQKIKKIYEIKYENGKEIDRNLISEETIDKGTAKVVKVGTKKKTTPKETTSTSSSSAGVWDRLASCESGGRWSLNTGNGYYGGLQISESTWNAAAPGLGITADLPSDASKSEQIQVATYLQENYGWSQWGACSQSLGL